MFPLNSEYPYILDTGQRTTLKEAIDSSFTDEKITKFLDPSTVARPTVWFSFDHPGIDNRASILEEYGFRGVYGFRPSDNTSVVKELVARGHDYSLYSGDSSQSVPARDASVATWVNYIKPAVEYFKNTFGLYNPTMYSCRGHFCTANQLEAAKQFGLIYARAATYDSDNTTSSGPGWQYPKVQDFNRFADIIRPNPIADGFNTCKTLIDNTITNNYTLCLFTHTFEFDSYPESVFRQVVEYVKLKVDQGVLDCLTPRQYYDKYRREIDFRNALIDIRAIKQALEDASET